MTEPEWMKNIYTLLKTTVAIIPEPKINGSFHANGIQRSLRSLVCLSNYVRKHYLSK